MKLLLNHLSNVDEEKSMVEIILFLNHLIINSHEQREILFAPYLDEITNAILNVIPIVKNICYDPFIMFLMNFINTFKQLSYELISTKIH